LVKANIGVFPAANSCRVGSRPLKVRCAHLAPQSTKSTLQPRLLNQTGQAGRQQSSSTGSIFPASLQI